MIFLNTIFTLIIITIWRLTGETI